MNHVIGGVRPSIPEGHDRECQADQHADDDRDGGEHEVFDGACPDVVKVVDDPIPGEEAFGCLGEVNHWTISRLMAAAVTMPTNSLPSKTAATDVWEDTTASSASLSVALRSSRVRNGSMSTGAAPRRTGCPRRGSSPQRSPLRLQPPSRFRTRERWPPPRRETPNGRRRVRPRGRGRRSG